MTTALRAIGLTALPREPRGVKLLHHERGNVAIVATFYAPTTTSPPYFTVVELDTPNEAGEPLRTFHLPLPSAAAFVSGLIPLQSVDGKEVYVVVQAVLKAEEAEEENGESRETAIYVYQRSILSAEEDEEARGPRNRAAAAVGSGSAVAASSSSPTIASGSRHGAGGICYHRLPNVLMGSVAERWTATAALAMSENTTAPAESAASFTTASGGGADGDGANKLQVWQLRHGEVMVDGAVQLPALAGFPVEEIVLLPGPECRVLIRCHHMVVEVHLAPLLQQISGPPLSLTSNEAIQRAWRWSPHDRLTACHAKDALLYAATESGVVLVYDMRLKPSQETADAPAAAAPKRSAASHVALTGLYAPHASGFVTCDAVGTVQWWTDDLGNPSGDAAAAAEEDGALWDVPLIAAQAAVASARFPYHPNPAVGSPAAEGGGTEFAGGEGCVALHGNDNFVAVVGEYGHLTIYLCD